MAEVLPLYWTATLAVRSGYGEGKLPDRCHSAIGSAHRSNAEDTGALLWPLSPKMQDCAGHYCIAVMISGCTQPTEVQNCMTI